MQVGCLVRRCRFIYAWQYEFIDTSYKVTAVSEDTKRIKLHPHDSWVQANQFEVIKFCMSHWEWVKPNHVGCCPKCGSAMLEDEDMR